MGFTDGSNVAIPLTEQRSRLTVNRFRILARNRRPQIANVSFSAQSTGGETEYRTRLNRLTMLTATKGPSLRFGGLYLYLMCVTPHQRKISVIVKNLLKWYPKNARDLPWRRTNDPYCVFVSEIMISETQMA